MTDLSKPLSGKAALVTGGSRSIGAAIARRNRPRLVWPFAVSSVMAVPAFFPPPAGSQIGLWLATTTIVVFWSGAIGTVIGAWIARAVIAGVRRIRSR